MKATTAPPPKTTKYSRKRRIERQICFLLTVHENGRKTATDYPRSAALLVQMERLS